jgi:hypothetical protein
MGVSSIGMGIGNSASRSTADAMSVEMHDQIKHFQNVLARNINQEIYRELLLEGGFDWYADPDKNWCHIVFEEIEVESQIKRETHILSLLQANTITITEARLLMGRQGFTEKDWMDSYLTRVLVPQDLIKKSGLLDLDEHLKVVKEQHAMAQAAHADNLKASAVAQAGGKIDNQLKQKQLDEPSDKTASHQTVTTGQTVKHVPGGGKSVSTTKSVKTPVQAPGPPTGSKTTAKGVGNKIRPRNQHGRRTGPKRSTEVAVYKNEALAARGVHLQGRVGAFEAELRNLAAELQAAAIEQAHLHLRSGSESDPQLVTLLFELTKGRLKNLSTNYLIPGFYQGIKQLGEDLGQTIPTTDWLNERTALLEYNEKTIHRFIGDLAKRVVRLIKKSDEQADLGEGIAELFRKELYRLNFIAMTEVPQAFWFGYASAARIMGTQLNLVTDEEACEPCTAAPREWTNSSSARKRLLQSPTLHVNCSCGLTPRGNQEENA